MWRQISLLKWIQRMERRSTILRLPMKMIRRILVARVVHQVKRAVVTRKAKAPRRNRSPAQGTWKDGPKTSLSRYRQTKPWTRLTSCRSPQTTQRTKDTPRSQKQRNRAQTERSRRRNSRKREAPPRSKEQRPEKTQRNLRKGQPRSSQKRPARTSHSPNENPSQARYATPRKDQSWRWPAPKSNDLVRKVKNDPRRTHAKTWRKRKTRHGSKTKIGPTLERKRQKTKRKRTSPDGAKSCCWTGEAQISSERNRRYSQKTGCKTEIGRGKKNKRLWRRTT